VTAVLSNDLMGAIGRADAENQRALREYGVYLYSYAPGGCYGSPERVTAWMTRGGILAPANAEQAA
jgi:hypothetical protein